VPIEHNGFFSTANFWKQQHPEEAVIGTTAFRSDEEKEGLKWVKLKVNPACKLPPSSSGAGG